MSAPQPAFLIDGRCQHKTSNALKITFADGPDGEPLALGEQGVHDSKSVKFATLLGFKNGGVGHHQLTLRGGSTLGIASLDGKPSQFTRGDGTLLATAQRGSSTTVSDGDGRTLLSVTGDPEEVKTPDLYRLQVADGHGSPVAKIEVIRTVGGWTLASEITSTIIWWDRAGQPLPIPILGTRITGYRSVSDLERDLLLAICVDIAIGLRPYVAEMQ